MVVNTLLHRQGDSPRGRQDLGKRRRRRPVATADEQGGEKYEARAIRNVRSRHKVLSSTRRAVADAAS